MPAEDDDAVSRLRLQRLLPDRARGWTPDQTTAPSSPPWSRRFLVTPGGSALTWLLLAGAVVVLVAAYVLWRHHGTAAAAPPASPARSGAPVVVASPESIVVDVGGRVRHPGLVTLPRGARVADAIEAAGGALRAADVATIDLAARVADGQLLLIGVRTATGAAGGSGTGDGSAPLDLNSATVEQLDALPGVGPVLAQRIVSFRDAHGGFRSVDDLQQVPGIGARKFADLKALVTA